MIMIQFLNRCRNGGIVISKTTQFHHNQVIRTTTLLRHGTVVTGYWHRNVSTTTTTAAAAAAATTTKNNNNKNHNSHTTQQQQQQTVIACAEAANALRLELPTTRDVGCRTKIVCTIGPATDTTERVTQLVRQGMSVARLNFSHVANSGTATDYYAYPQHCRDLIRTAPGRHSELTKVVSSQSSSPLQSSSVLVPNLRAVLVDTKGPEIRTKGPLPGNVTVYEIQTGDTVELHVDVATTTTSSSLAAAAKDPTVVQLIIDYANIAKTVQPGGQVLLDDGLIALHVVECFPDRGVVSCLALNAGPIKVNKGVNLPGVASLDLPALTEQDCHDLYWAVEQDADYIAASFIRTPDHVRAVIAYLERCLEQKRSKLSSSSSSQEATASLLRPLVISKIESKEGVDNFHEILRESDGIMVARGDLGVEIPYSKVFAAQKMMIEACNAVGKPVIVATQMLDSMIRNPRPTRAEVTDVGTAVLDGADAVMLSGETAAGKYPIDSLKAMVSVVWEADQIVASRRKEQKDSGIIWNHEMHANMDRQEQELDAVAAAAVRSAHEMGAKMIVAITMSGRVARAVARHRPTVPVLAFCTQAAVARRLQLHRSIYPVLSQSMLDPGSASTRMGILRAEAIRTAKELGWARSGDRIVFIDRTQGKEHDLHHFSHNMKVVTLRDS